MDDSGNPGRVDATDAGADPVPVVGAATLRDLLHALDAWSVERETLAAGSGLPDRAGWPGLPALDEFRGLWAGLRTREQVRRALAPAPVDAGPLNSRTLVHRMLALMHAQAPGYLEHFTAYVDTLADLQALQDRTAPAAAAGARAPAKVRGLRSVKRSTRRR